MRWKKLPGLTLLLALSLLLTSCFDVQVESEFNEDGSGTHSYRATIEKEAMEEFGESVDEAEFDDDFDESAETAREMGYDVERINTDEHLGIRLSRDYDDSENIDTILNDLFTLGSEEPVSPFEGSFTSDGGTHTLDLTVNGGELLGEEIQDEGDISPAMLSGFITMTYTVTMPGEIDEEETNGRILDDGRVQWDLPLTGTENFVAVSTTDSGVSTLMLAGVIGLLFLFIGGAAALALFLIMRNRRAQPAPEAAAPAGYGVDPDAPTAPYPHATQDPNKPPTQNF